MIDLTQDNFNRIEKLFVDRDGVSADAARKRLSGFRLKLSCGPEVATSATLQVALLTAVNTAKRCFGGKIVLDVSRKVRDAELRVCWHRHSTLMDALVDLCPSVTEEEPSGDQWEGQVVFGTRQDVSDGLQVTFDGWSVAVAPLHASLRLPERDKCNVAGVAAGALAVSELFLSYAGVTVEAGRRCVGLSLWRPDLCWTENEAVGPDVEFLPSEFWLLGLGHLGQAFLWAISFLPFLDRRNIALLLNDFDHVVPANVGTGLLTKDSDVGRLKTRVAADWLESLGFQTRLTERPFDDRTRIYDDEPALGLCGFDRDGPRWALDDVGFQMVVECGLGGRSDNFDAISLHSLPSDSRRASERWLRTGGGELEARRVESLTKQNPVYRQIARERGCGHIELAGKAIAVPFVGAIAGALGIAEVLRATNGGERYEAVDLRLECPAAIEAWRQRGNRRPRLRFQILPNASEGSNVTRTTPRQTCSVVPAQSDRCLDSTRQSPSPVAGE